MPVLSVMAVADFEAEVRKHPILRVEDLIDRIAEEAYILAAEIDYHDPDLPELIEYELSIPFTTELNR